MTQPTDGASAADWRHRLTAALAEPLADRESAPGETREAVIDDPPARRAGVLIPIVGAARPYIYFTQRSDALRHHPGQISFPGGSMEPFDRDAEAAALREAHEEIGLDPVHVEILGELPEYRTVTGFVISPFVGWVAPTARVTPDRVEVTRIFGVPLEHALDHRQFRRQMMERAGRTYQVYSIDYDDDHIWGATAGILYGLLQRLSHVEAREAPAPGAYRGAGG